MGSVASTAVPKKASLTISARSTVQATAWRTRRSLKGGLEQFRNRMYGNTGRAGVWLIVLELIRVLTCCGGTPWIHWAHARAGPDGGQPVSRSADQHGARWWAVQECGTGMEPHLLVEFHVAGRWRRALRRCGEWGRRSLETM